MKDRKLIVNSGEAKFVNRLFRLYLELGCVRKLKACLDAEGIVTKRRTSAAGSQSGGTPYARGALYKILQNRIYLGQIHHRKYYYPGEHDPIISRELWDQVQDKLRTNLQGSRNGPRAGSPSLLGALLEDSDGKRFTASHTLKNGRRYRYYVCHSKSGDQKEHKAVRLPAHDVERQIVLRLQSFLRSHQAVIEDCSLPGESPALSPTINRSGSEAV